MQEAGEKRRKKPVLCYDGTMTYYLDGLNQEQQESVFNTEGAIRVIAGAGTGKTRALAYRFAYLVNDLGILPSNILCVTFTNKSANEMRQRIHQLTGDNDTGLISTFHGFCNTVLLEESNAIAYPKNFIVLDNSDIDEMLKIIYEERNLTLRHMTFSKAREMIEIIKLQENPEYYLDLIQMDLDKLKQKYKKAKTPKDIIFYGYLYQCKKCFGLDYNDLIILTLSIFEQNQEIRLKWQKRLEYIMIDEFQDIDDLQYRLMKVLAAYHKNLFIVGDPDQTIYTWRGARIRYLLHFDQDFPETKTIMMPKNYRSAPPILKAANSLIAHNQQRIKKDLLPMSQGEEEVLVHFAKNEEKEAEWIAERIIDLKRKGKDYHEMAILYRAHYISRSLEEVFLKKEIPYTIYSGVQFFQRLEIKDALSYLRMIAHKDDLSFLRIINTPKRNIGQKRIKFLKEEAEKKGISLYEALEHNRDHELFQPTKANDFIDLIEKFSLEQKGVRISDLFSKIMNASGYEQMLRTEGSQERLDNLAELKQSIMEYERQSGEEIELADYLNHIALFSNADLDRKKDSVKLMTIHTAKGLEFPYVFLMGMNEGMFPTKKVKSADSMEEERRLAFVAMTRAKDQLFLSGAQGRNFDGSPKYPSRFVLNIDSKYVHYTPKVPETLLDDALQFIQLHTDFIQKQYRELEFRVGMRIQHPAFGEGTIIETDPLNKVYTIHFDRLATDRKISYRAKLVKVNQEKEEAE